jgi:hypothetical protein
MALFYRFWRVTGDQAGDDSRAPRKFIHHNVFVKRVRAVADRTETI